MEVEVSNGTSHKEKCENNSKVNELFKPCQHVARKSLGPRYILHLSGTSQSNPYIAAALSDHSAEVFGVNESEITKLLQLRGHTEKLVDCRFCTDNGSLLYTGSNDGSVKLWDIRDSDRPAVNFLDTTLGENSTIKQISCFDVSLDNRLLAAGTDLTEGDAFILFWDIRSHKLLGAYWESHMDDITQVKFHPKERDTLMSGSTDGLINIYDLSQGCEDDALRETLNTESLVENLLWFDKGKLDRIGCTTSTIDLQLWDVESAEPYRNLSRADISDQVKIDSYDTYVAKVLRLQDSLMVIAGSNPGLTDLRSFQIFGDKMRFGLQFAENTQRVRSVWYDPNINVLATGGESGILDLWRPDIDLLNIKI